MVRLSEHISLTDEYTPFGIVREAGCIAYDITNKKSYIFIERGEAWECLNSFTGKRELEASVATVHDLTIDNSGALYGFSVPNGFGALDPDTIGTETIKRIDSAGVFVSVQTVAEGKIDGVDSLSVEFTGHGTVVFTWNTNLYRVVDGALHTFLVNNDGNTISITITLV